MECGINEKDNVVNKREIYDFNASVLDMASVKKRKNEGMLAR